MIRFLTCILRAWASRFLSLRLPFFHIQVAETDLLVFFSLGAFSSYGIMSEQKSCLLNEIFLNYFLVIFSPFEFVTAHLILGYLLALAVLSDFSMCMSSAAWIKRETL